MATSSRQSSIFGVNDWKTIYRTYKQADFQSYDYETLRKTFVDYLRITYPETFNDYVESSEYVALLDVMAFMGQALSFRDDLNTRENFIDTAERRDSVIKLANLVGYNPKRNITGQGYLKITAIQTTEQVKDINGLNLSNLTILWADPANPNWQEQFNSIVNATLIDAQRVGRPGNSKTILDIKTDEYSISTPTGSIATAPFSTTVDGTSMDFECVSVTSVDADSLYELPPGPNNRFNILYRNDRLGYGSPNTGFFMYFKQGSLQTYNFNLKEQISSQVVDIDIQGINNTDTWLYNYDSTTGVTTQWQQVESIYAYNKDSQAANINKKVFSIVSRFNDQVSYTFGDGVFGEIPIGNFTAYVRSGNALTYTINPSEMQGITVTIDYVSRTGRVETLTLTMELTLPVSNAQARETLADIKQRAPQRYYSQNRMVNGEDYNNFPYTLYGSIIKSKALNRSSVGVSRNYDLLDPSAKYSSTNTFADDGGIYLDESDGYTNFTANTTNDTVAFLTEVLNNELNNHRSFQYYTQHYKRYDIGAASGDGVIAWHQSSFNTLESTGYFYNNLGPVPIGVFSTGNVKYITEGALLKFIAPSGYYFDSNNKLIEGLPTPSDSTFIWTSVASVNGDGSNNGQGNLNNGLGPVVLNNPIPNGVVLTTVLPSFTNLLPNDIIQECIKQVTLNQSFSLVYNNNLLANQTRWALSTFDDSKYFVKFESLGSNRYLVTYKSVAYYFGSVANVRFTFTKNHVIYDPTTGKLLQDFVNILKVNSYPDSNYPMPKDTKLSVVGQLVESDGYVDDYSVEVASTDPNVAGVVKDPDFFYQLSGFKTGTKNTHYFVFFERITDINLLSRYQMVSSNDINYSLPTRADIALVRYEYAVGQIYYAYREDTFYQAVNDLTSANVVNLVQINNYIAKTGRQGIAFQYRHNSNNTTRIDPATTNIIDLYVVTQSYYTQYQNWIKDTTNKLTEPSPPTISELNLIYSEINNYKMLTDSVILNSVKFKPLFGSKAEPQLRSTIKVIKSSGTTASDSEIRTAVLSEMNTYFSIDNWNFGDTFYFTELSAYLHSKIGDLVNSVVLVPNDPTLSFGDLYEIRSAPYEIFVNAAQATDIMVIASLTPAELQINK
jgi:hypothetical protein